MEAPDFIETTVDDILNSLITKYEANILARTGVVRKLQPAQLEYIQFETVAAEIYTRASLRIQSAAEKNLPQFATYPVLDMLSMPYGVERLPEDYAKCKATLTLNAGHGALVIPAGIRIQSQDGQVTFVLKGNIPVAADVNEVIADLICDQAGVVGNGYVAGKISVILDPQAYLVSAVNNDITAGGAEVESDENERERLYLSSSAVSTAGSKKGYKYWAKTASSLILDVSINNGAGGVVNIYPLVAGGVTPTEILEAVEAACNDEDRVPTSDTVNAYSPTIVNYAINIDIYLYSSYADPQGLILQGLKNVQAFANANAQKLGIDVILSQLITVASMPSVENGVAKVVVNSPVADIVVSDTQVAICTGVVYNLVGFNDDK